MQRNKKGLWFIVMLIILLIPGCGVREDGVQLTKRIFYSLCSGNRGAQNWIAWERLKAVGVDVGATYSSIIKEKERVDYRKAFFYNFSMSFRSGGGKTSGFFNWQVIQKDGTNTVVAADTASGKSLLFTLSIVDGKQKLTAIEWQGTGTPAGGQDVSAK